MQRTPAILSAVVFFLASSGASARPATIDLADQDPGSTDRRLVESGTTLEITIINRMPKTAYDVTVDVRAIPIEPLPIPDFAPAQKDCSTLVGRFEAALGQSADEDAVRAAVRTFRAEARGCAEPVPTHLEQSIALNTTRSVGSYSVPAGSVLTVTVVRQGDTPATWVTEFSTGARGEWRTSYGFNFVPNEDETFFAKPDGDEDGDSFTITPRADREDFDFAPSLFYTWLPRRQQTTNLAFGPVAGLGFSREEPIVFGGLAITWNQNISLNLGAVVHKQRRLNGRFEAGDTISEALESDQLEETTYGLNYFVGLSFRLGENPFNQSDDEDDQGSSDE